MHGKRMREANHRAAVQIFQRVNKSLLPRNILDLHGLHVDEALEHLAQVLQDKSTGDEQLPELFTLSLMKQEVQRGSCVRVFFFTYIRLS